MSGAERLKTQAGRQAPSASSGTTSGRKPVPGALAEAAAKAGILPGLRVVLEGGRGRRPRRGIVRSLGPKRALVALPGGPRGPRGIRLPYARLAPSPSQIAPGDRREREEELKARIGKAVDEALRLLKRNGLDRWDVRLDGSPGRAAQCDHAGKAIRLSPWLAAHWPPEELRDALLHEIAHALVGPERSHGRVWKAMALALGCSARTSRRTGVPRHRVQWSHRRMPRSIRVRVEQGDIDCGSPGDGDSCPVTLALARRLEEMEIVAVGAKTFKEILRVAMPVDGSFLVKRNFDYRLPAKAVEFLRRFDDTVPYGPQGDPSFAPVSFTARRIPAVRREPQAPRCPGGAP